MTETDPPFLTTLTASLTDYHSTTTATGIGKKTFEWGVQGNTFIRVLINTPSMRVRGCDSSRIARQFFTTCVLYGVCSNKESSSLIAKQIYAINIVAVYQKLEQ